jgi:hypothetical protein
MLLTLLPPSHSVPSVTLLRNIFDPADTRRLGAGRAVPGSQRATEPQNYQDAYTAGQLQNLLRVLPWKPWSDKRRYLYTVRVSLWCGILIATEIFDLYASARSCMTTDAGEQPPVSSAVVGSAGGACGKSPSFPLQVRASQMSNPAAPWHNLAILRYAMYDARRCSSLHTPRDITSARQNRSPEVCSRYSHDKLDRKSPSGEPPEGLFCCWAVNEQILGV